MKDRKTLGLWAIAFSAAAFMGVFFYLWQSGRFKSDKSLDSVRPREEVPAVEGGMGAVAEEKGQSPAGGHSGGESAPQELTLAVLVPQDGAVVTQALLVVSGKVTPGAAVDVNEVEASVSEDGNWQATLTLEKGENIVAVSASDEWGNEKEVIRTVTY